MRQTIREGTRVLWKESACRMRTTLYFAQSFDEPGGKGTFEVPHSCLYLVSLVRISELCVRKFVVHLRAVYASPQKLARPLRPALLDSRSTGTGTSLSSSSSWFYFRRPVQPFPAHAESRNQSMFFSVRDMVGWTRNEWKCLSIFDQLTTNNESAASMNIHNECRVTSRSLVRTDSRKLRNVTQSYCVRYLQ